MRGELNIDAWLSYDLSMITLVGAFSACIRVMDDHCCLFELLAYSSTCKR